MKSVDFDENGENSDLIKNRQWFNEDSWKLAILEKMAKISNPQKSFDPSLEIRSTPPPHPTPPPPASWELDVVKGKGTHEPKAQTAGPNPGFFSMKHTKEYCYSRRMGR